MQFVLESELQPVELCRRLAIAAVVLIVGTGYLQSHIQPETAWQLAARGCVSLLLLTFVIATYTSSAVRRNPSAWILPPLGAVSAWIATLAYFRNLDAPVSIGWLLVIAASSLVFRDKRPLTIYLGLCVVAVLTVSVIVPDPIVKPHLFAVLMLGFLVLEYIGVGDTIDARIALEAGRNLMDANFHGSNDAQLYVDPRTGAVLLMNDGCKRMFGVTRPTQMAPLIYAAVRPGAKRGEAPPVDWVTGAGAWPKECRFPTAVGTEFWGTITALRMPMVKLDLMLIQVVDISQQKAAEAALVRAKELAEEATRVRTQFLANMSHEIRTPMNAVIGMTGLLLHTGLNERQREYVDIVRVSGESLLTIINDILDFAKIEAGHVELETHPFELEQCIADSVELLATQAHAKGLELVAYCDKNVPFEVLGDSNRIRQVIVNLVANAVKFTAHGHVYVQVAATAVDGGRCRVECVVEDTGPGIAQDRIDQLFQAFVQGDASTTRRFGGTGLGLAISRHLARSMGGDITVESRVGEGSRFKFTALLDVGATRHKTDESLLKGLRAMVVDDNAINRRILELTLGHWGVEVESCDSPLVCLDETDASFAFVITDHQMAGMDGAELASELQRKLGGACPPVLMLTSAGPEAIESTPHIAGLLSKPVKRASLRRSLERLLGHEGAQIERAGQRPLPPKATAARDRQRTLRVLVVEDNVVNQKVAARMLEQLGHRIDVANNGAEAVERVAVSSFDLILMDMQMPVMDGLEATRRIRAQSEALAASRPFIVAMTANALDGDREACLAAGMDDYLAKPVRLQSLAALIARIGESRSGDRSYLSSGSR